MGVVWPETLAWKAYLESERSDADAENYLGKQFSGAV
jgi:hypothetical protein